MEILHKLIMNIRDSDIRLYNNEYMRATEVDARSHNDATGPPWRWYRITTQTRRIIEEAFTDLKKRLRRRVIGESTKVAYDRQQSSYTPTTGAEGMRGNQGCPRQANPP